MLIAPFASDRIKHAAYELSLGEEAYVTSSGCKITRRRGEHITIPPGQFALLHSAEIVHVPADALAFISIKARIKLKGLINVSGFHVDPGFRGQLVFSVHNAGSRPVTIACGDPCFLIWFGNLTQATADTYDGGHRGQSGISPDAIDRINGEIASPAELSARLRDVSRAMKAQWALIGILFTLVIASIFQPTITRWFERTTVSTPTQTTSK